MTFELFHCELSSLIYNNLDQSLITVYEIKVFREYVYVNESQYIRIC